MKRIPTVLAILTASFLTICVFQARGRGVGFVPAITEWEMHPAWWHFPILADVGEYLVVTPGVFVVALPISKLLGTGVTVAWASVGFVVLLESALVSYVAQLITRLARKRPTSRSIQRAS